MSPRRRSGKRPRDGRRAGRPERERAGANPVGRTRRLPALAVLVGLLVAGGIVDREVDRGSALGATEVIAPVPVAAPASARSSAWYCPGVPVT
ncbi:MAG: hypothetical protein ACR2KK_12735, partial [Acidimicrobiales bacterium]